MSFQDKCCLEGCPRKGEYPLSKIEGRIKIKRDLVGSMPRDWKLCKEDFNRIVKGMKCCIDGCQQQATLFEITASKRPLAKIRQDCCHSQLCLDHSQKYSELADKQPVKREPQGVDNLLPPQKKQADDEDTVTETNDQINSDTSTEVHEEEMMQQQNQMEIVPPNEEVAKEPVEPKQQEIPTETKPQEVTSAVAMKEEIPVAAAKEEKEIPNEVKQNEQNELIKIDMKEKENKEDVKEEHHCCISSCNEKVFGEVPILQPLPFYICEGHHQKIIKSWKVSLLQKQVVLNEECLKLIKDTVGENTNNPLYNYTNPQENDVKCALCCGVYTTEETYSCSFCPFTFCVECYKHLCLTLGCPQQFISNKARWKCFVCSRCERNSMHRDIFIKEQLQSLLETLEKRLGEGCLIGTSEDELREFIESVK